MGELDPTPLKDPQALLLLTGSAISIHSSYVLLLEQPLGHLLPVQEEHMDILSILPRQQS